MANKDWAMELAEKIRKESPSLEVHIADVVSVKPLELEIAGQRIKKYLYINPAFILQPEESFTHNPIDIAWFAFLKKFHKAYALSAGDQVVALQSNTEFYIIAKVVAA